MGLRGPSREGRQTRAAMPAAAQDLRPVPPLPRPRWRPLRRSPDEEVPQVSKLTMRGVLDCGETEGALTSGKAPFPQCWAGKRRRGPPRTGEPWAPWLLPSGGFCSSREMAQ